MKYLVKDDLKTWEDIKKYLDLFVLGWCFRGQRDAIWGLETSLERATTKVTNEMAESVVFRSFTRNAHNYLQSHEIPTVLLEWFSIMQHYGAPTRLLDWTYSPYVASFFALEDAIDEKGESAIWAIEYSWCRSQGLEVIRNKLVNDPKYKKFRNPGNVWDNDDFRKVFHEQKLHVVFPVEPYRRNERLTIQNGLFLCPGNPNKGFEGNFEEYDQNKMEKHIVKIIIPNKLRVEILTELNYMNINRATLFPGLEGFSQSLKQAIINIEDHGLIQKKITQRHKHGKPFI